MRDRGGDGRDPQAHRVLVRDRGRWSDGGHRQQRRGAGNGAAEGKRGTLRRRGRWRTAGMGGGGGGGRILLGGRIEKLPLVLASSLGL
jgi:hypothetical protein